MGRVIWSPSALEDADRIAEHISRDSPAYAGCFIERCLDSTALLEDYPLAGRVIPEIADPSSREIIYRPYRIMYKLVGDEVWITAVIHGAMDWKPPGG
jgi:toxin ParE1/3/4